jgi:hypothetical protein
MFYLHPTGFRPDESGAKMGKERRKAPDIEVWSTTSRITSAHRRDHILARMAWRRMAHLVEPGLYSLGEPDGRSPVFVTANYTLSFDALRTSLDGVDGYILVLDTKGVNVWCAAGKGTFGTEELIGRVAATRLAEVVSHRRLVLPQLGAPGVNALQVKRETGFRVEWGPVRAADLPDYLRSGRATPEMRRVRFPLRDRAVLVGVELVSAWPLFLVFLALLAFAENRLAVTSLLVAVMAGAGLFPLLLPWLPTRAFSTKGLVLGVLVVIPYSLVALLSDPGEEMAKRVGGAATYLLIHPPITAYLALQFTGSSTFTSRTGVRREIFRWVPVMAGSLLAGIVLLAILSICYGPGVM